MSNPLATFRKHRTYWMAALVLIAILSFIVVPAIQQASTLMVDDVGNSVLVRWNGGQITERDLAHNRIQHGRMIRLLYTLGQKVIDAGGMPGIPGFNYNAQEKRIAALGIPEFNSDLAQCRTRILAARAKELGIEFSDEAVDAFIRDFCNRKIPREEFRKIYDEATDKQLSQFELYKQLKLEMAAVVMERLALAGVNSGGSPTLTPGKMWQNYLRLNQSARVEAFPVNTADFKNQVTGEPTNAEIEQLYSAGSQNEPVPGSSAPAFRRPYKASIEYVFASWNKLVEQEKGKISEEKLREEYDKQVKLNQLQVPVDTPQAPAVPPAQTGESSSAPTSAPAANAVPPATATESTSAPSETKSDPKPADTASPAVNQPAPVAPQPAEPKPEAPKSAQEIPAPSTKVDEKPAETSSPDKKPADPQAPEAPKTSQNSRGSIIKLVSATQETQPQESKAQESAKPAAPSTPPETPPTPASNSAQSPADNSANAGTPLTAGNEAGQPLAAVTEPASPPPVVQPPQLGEPSTAPLATAVPTTPDAPKMRTQTFEEAKDSIARTLAFEPVRELIRVKMQKIEQEMSRYHTKVSMVRSAEQTDGPSQSLPTRPDLKKLAETEGLEYGQTGMVDGFALAALPLGISSINSASGELTVANSVMNPQIELFSTLRSTFIDRAALMRGETPDFQEFAFWKVDHQLSATPPLTEVRTEVVDVWKTQKAQELAAREAENIAKKVAGSADAWKSSLSTTDQALVAPSGQFTWLTQSQGMFGRPVLSQVDGIAGAGDEFMSKVFSAEPGKIVVAPNYARSVFYVAKVVELTPNQDELQTRFQADNLRMAPRSVAFQEAEQMFRSWYESIEAEMQVEWLVPFDQLN